MCVPVRTLVFIRVNAINTCTGLHVQEIAESTVARRTDDVLATTIDDEAVILEMDSGTYYGFNETATFVWEQLEEPQAVSNLLSALVEEYDVDPEQCERNLETVLTDMAEYGLIDFQDGA
jgi:hypothetical protein